MPINASGKKKKKKNCYKCGYNITLTSRVAKLTQFLFLFLSLKWSQYWYCILHPLWAILSPWLSSENSFSNTILQSPSPSSPSLHLLTPALPPITSPALLPITSPASPPPPLPLPSSNSLLPLSLNLSHLTPPTRF